MSPRAEVDGKRTGGRLRIVRPEETKRAPVKIGTSARESCPVKYAQVSGGILKVDEKEEHQSRSRENRDR